MSEREDNVYKAKLAEQAERYDGKLKFLRCVRKMIVVLYCCRCPYPWFDGFRQCTLPTGSALGTYRFGFAAFVDCMSGSFSFREKSSGPTKLIRS